MGELDATSPETPATIASAPSGDMTPQIYERLERERRLCARCQALEDLEIDAAIDDRRRRMGASPVDVPADVPLFQEGVPTRPDGV